MQAALQRAMDQLEAAKDGKLSTEALQQAMESMDLSKMELQQMAQSVRDMKSLEEALKTLPAPMFGYCRSGARAGSLFSAAKSAIG